MKKSNKTCVQCGNCCKVLFFPASKDYAALSSKDFLEARKIKLENGLVKVPHVCPQLTETGSCRINDTKPQSCKDWQPGSDPICPLFDEGGKRMDELMKDAISFDSKTAAELAVMRKSGSILGRKTLPIDELSVGVDEEGRVFVKGYANTKGHPDRYGDIPMVFAALRAFVYGLDNFKLNPVCLMNHDNEIEAVVGSFQPALGGYCEEDEKGLRVKLVFSKSNFGPCAHARTIYREGHGRAFSIGGRWSYEDKDNPTHLTYAEIYEISIVGVGADQQAVTDAPGEKGTAKNLQEAIGLIAESIKAGQVLTEAERTALMNVAAVTPKLADKWENMTDDEKFQAVSDSLKAGI